MKSDWYNDHTQNCHSKDHHWKHSLSLTSSSRFIRYCIANNKKISVANRLRLISFIMSTFRLPDGCRIRRIPCDSIILLRRSIVSSYQEKSFGATPTYVRGSNCFSAVSLRGLLNCRILIKKIHTISFYRTIAQ